MDTHLDTSKSLKKFRCFCVISYVFMTSPMSDFYVILKFLSKTVYRRIYKLLFLPRVCVMRGSTNSQSLMCRWLCVAELFSYNRRKCHFQYLACLKWRTLSDKISSDKIFDGQNVSSDKIFDTKLEFRHFCPTKFCPIRYIL